MVCFTERSKTSMITLCNFTTCVMAIRQATKLQYLELYPQSLSWYNYCLVVLFVNKSAIRFIHFFCFIEKSKTNMQQVLSDSVNNLLKYFHKPEKEVCAFC